MATYQVTDDDLQKLADQWREQLAEETAAKMAALEARARAAEALANVRGPREPMVKRGSKGLLSAYIPTRGFPVTLTDDQWRTLLAMSDMIREGLAK